MTFNSFFQLIWDTILSPSTAAQQVMAVRLSRGHLWMGVLLASVLSALVGGISQALFPVEPMLIQTAEGPVQFDFHPASPLMQGLVVGASLVLMVFALYFSGQLLGGQGTFPATLALMAWLQVVMVVVQVATLVLSLVAPVVGALLVFVSFAVFLRCMAVFVNELHRFDSIGRAILTIIVAFFGVAIGLTFLLIISGINLGG